MPGSFRKWVRELAKVRPWGPGWMAFILLFIGPLYCVMGLWTYSEFPGGEDQVPARIAIGVVPPLYYLIRRFVLRMDDRFDVWMYTALLWSVSFHNLYVSLHNGMTPFHIADFLGTLLIIMAGTLSPLQTLAVGTVSALLLTIGVLQRGILSGPVLSGLVTNLMLECLLITLGNYQRARALDRSERESADLERILINSLGEGVVLRSVTGELVYSNLSALRILGEGGLDLLEKSAIREDGASIPHEELPSFVTLHTGKPVRDLIIGVTRADGQHRWLRLNTVPMNLFQLRRNGRSPRGVLLVFQDITQEREMQRIVAMREAQISEGARLSALGELAAGVGHEINNPLAAMKLRLEMLRGAATEQSPQFVEELPRILKSVERIERIVLSLRNLSRDAVDDQFTACSVAQIVQDAIEVVETKSVSSGIQIGVDIDPQARVRARAGQISQVILNLVQNSIDAIVANEKRKGQQWIRICQKIVPSASGGTELVLSVEDSGPGIPESVRSKLAQPFFTTKPPGKGTGLGLSISRTIMEKHGGLLVPRFDLPYTCFELHFPQEEPQTAVSS